MSNKTPFWKSKIVQANVVGGIVALLAIFGVEPEMSGKTAQVAGVLLPVLTIILRMFFNHNNTS